MNDLYAGIEQGERKQFIARMTTIASEIADAWFLTKQNDPEAMRELAHKILDANLVSFLRFSFADAAKKYAINRVADKLFKEWTKTLSHASLAQYSEVRAALDSVISVDDLAEEVKSKGLAQRVMTWRMHQRGASLKEIAQRHKIPVTKVRELLAIAKHRRQLLTQELKLYD